MAASAQDEPEYKMEIGAGVGLVSYVGDYNSNPLKGMQPWLALVAKYRLDPRVAIAFDLGTGKLKGKAEYASRSTFSVNKTSAWLCVKSGRVKAPSRVAPQEYLSRQKKQSFVGAFLFTSAKEEIGTNAFSVGRRVPNDPLWDVKWYNARIRLI